MVTLNLAMSFIRKRLPWIAAAWVALQAAALVTAPVVLFAATASVEDVVCDCPDEMPGAQCPMHRSAAGHDDEARCRMRSATLPADSALLVLTISAPPVPVMAVEGDSTRFETISDMPAIVASRSLLPDSPPPRF